MVIDRIPPCEMASTEGVVCRAVDEEFVDVHEYSGGRIAVDMQYAKMGYDGAITTAYLRREAADRLIRAAELLPSGLRLKIYDAWRPFEVQKALYDEYYQKLAKSEKYRDFSPEKLHALARTYVSYPDRAREFAYVHSSGGAVDLTVIDADGVELDMGCGFDDFREIATVHALEGGIDCEARSNRRLLYHVMTLAGFTSYPAEWWHYDFGDVFWGAMSAQTAKYASVYSLSEMTIVRRDQYVNI